MADPITDFGNLLQYSHTVLPIGNE